MQRIDIDAAIRQHTQWRRQFLNAFAGGAYADMPLSAHRGCSLCAQLQALTPPPAEAAALIAADRHFHELANEIVELSHNGLSADADLLLPELTEASHQLVSRLDHLRSATTA